MKNIPRKQKQYIFTLKYMCVHCARVHFSWNIFTFRSECKNLLQNWATLFRRHSHSQIPFQQTTHKNNNIYFQGKRTRIHIQINHIQGKIACFFPTIYLLNFIQFYAEYIPYDLTVDLMRRNYLFTKIPQFVHRINTPTKNVRQSTPWNFRLFHSFSFYFWLFFVIWKT